MKHLRWLCALALVASPVSAGSLHQSSATRCDAAFQPDANDGAVAQAWRKLVQDGFEGAVAIRSKGRVVFCGVAGKAAADRPFDHDTLVDIASVSKPVTAMALLRLEHAGALSLDDRLDRWFPQAPADKAGLTLRQMLTHFSGMADLPPDVDDRTRIDQDEMTAKVFALPVVMPPEKDWSYSNSAYNLLAQVVERASGLPFGTYVRDQILKLAGVDGGYDPAAFPLERVADMRVKDGWLTLHSIAAEREGPFWGLWGAGGLYMSANDLAALFDAFLEGRIVPQDAARQAALTGVYPVGDLGFYTVLMGRMDRPFEGLHFHDKARLHFHAGGSDHSTSQVRWYPEEGLVITAVSNLGMNDDRATPNHIDVPATSAPNALAAAEALDRSWFGVAGST